LIARDNRSRVARTTLGLAAILVPTIGLIAHPPAARAYDGIYYEWCKQAVGEEAYCCAKAGGVWNGGCDNAAPSPTPNVLPPIGGILTP
jgi:hypothetical protein